MSGKPVRTVPLEQMKVESPCPVSWAQMTSISADDRRRHCAHCGLDVHNLSAITRDEAQRLICETAGRLCVAYIPSASGTITTLEYHQPKQPRYSWRTVAALAGLAAVAGTALGAFLHRSKPATTFTAGVAPPVMVPGMLAPPQTVTPAPPASKQE